MTRWKLFITLFALALAPIAQAREVPRTILGIHDNPVTAGVDESSLYSIAEMPLNHLGLKLEYANIRTETPRLTGRSDIRGVLIWFNDGRKLPLARLVSLVKEATSRSIPVVLVGSIPNETDDKGKQISLADQNRLLSLLELQSEGKFLPYTFDLRVRTKVSEYVELERKLPNPPPATEAITPLRDSARALLSYDRKGDEGGLIYPVVLTDKGGYIASGFSHFEGRNGAFLQWYVNPFRFFADAFRTKGMPIPDTTTVAGRRIFYSHIDGDGWGNVSTADKYSGKGLYASEVILRDVVDGFPDLPVTVAPIAADLDPAWTGTIRSQQIARALFSRRNVEPASHTYTHPFEWRFFGPGYKPENELPFLAKYAKHNLAPGMQAKPHSHKSQLSHNYDAPRAFGDIPYSLKREMEGSAAYINAFCPPGKKVRLIQWSGDTSPTEDAVAAAIRAGLLNLNGRDTRFDGDTPSYTAVSPLGKRSGKFMQVSASHANENVYTDLWQGRFFGFRYLVSSLQNTERPLRVKPVNIYYHMYSGEKQASLKALTDVMEHAASLELAPITATDYAAIGQGFYTLRLEELAPLKWRVVNRGALNTLRMDNAGTLAVDAQGSKGVLGARRTGSTLYIALDPASAAPEVALTSAPPEKQGSPLLVDSRWQIRGLILDGTSARFTAQGFGPGEMTWIVPVLSPNERWEARTGSHTVQSSLPDAQGKIRFALPRGAEEGVSVVISRSQLRPAIR